MVANGKTFALLGEIMMEMAGLPTTALTEEQYLELERLAETKSEFHDGQMFAMAGGTLNHSLLSTTICSLLREQAPKGCRTLNSDMRIKIEQSGLYTYPDGSVIWGEPKFLGNRRDVILNPMLIVEVLSPSTEDYDRGKKFESYRTIASFQEYLVVHQDRRHVEHYSKQDDGSWVLREYLGAEGPVLVGRLGVRIELAELYESALDVG
jgi:Uma2 family endonuclease